MTYESGAATRVSPKSAAVELEAYFFEILDNYDEERVYPSDIKKIMQWYNLLLSKKMIPLPETAQQPVKNAQEEKTEMPSKK